MKLIIANYRTGSTTFSLLLGGDGDEWLHNTVCDYRPPTPELDVYKVIPDQFHYDRYYEQFKKDYLENADEIYYTLREDVSNQIKSHAYCGISNDWHPWQKLTEPDWDADMQVSLEYSFKVILKCLEWQSKIYKEFGGKLVWLEDRNDGEKYTRRLDLDQPDVNVNIDVKGMFL